MGIIDDLSSAFDGGLAGARRIADKTSLKFKLSEADRKRRDLMAQFGESLYEKARANSSLREGREAILDGIAALDAERAAIQAEMERVEKEAAEAKKAVPLTCSVCGGTLVAQARFCPTCGAMVYGPAQAQAAYTQAHPAQPQQPGSAQACEPTQTYEVPEGQQER